MLWEVFCDLYSRGSSDKNRRVGGKYSQGENVSGSGMSVVNLEHIYLNEELRNNSGNLGQIIVVDSGCPRSLMGDS